MGCDPRLAIGTRLGMSGHNRQYDEFGVTIEATKLSGDSTFYHIAVNHADRTLKEHFRTNGSCYHVIDYSLADGMVRHRQTAQGYADESTWSRGQAWAIYGYTVCYRETHDKSI